MCTITTSSNSTPFFTEVLLTRRYSAAGFPPLFYMLYAVYLDVLQRLGILTFLLGWNVLGDIWKFGFLNRFLFFVKAFYLPFDLVGLAAFLSVLKPKHRVAGATAWMLNPAILYITYCWGQADIIVGSLVMVSLYFAKKALEPGMRIAANGLYSCLAIGFSAAFKLFTVSLLPLFSLACSSRSQKRWVLCAIAGIVPLGSMLPFVSKPFLEMMLPYAGYVLSSFTVAQGYGFTIYIVFALYLAIMFGTYFVVDCWNFDKLLAFGLATFFLLYGVSVWLPNWILWGTPLILLTTVRRKQLFWVYTLINLFYFVLVQAWGNTLWVGLFSPLFDSVVPLGALAFFPGIRVMFPNLTNALAGLGFTGIGASLLFMIFFTWKQRTVESDAPAAAMAVGGNSPHSD